MASRIGVIFDMDGVLVDTYAPHLRSWCLLAEETGFSVTEQQFAATFGKTSREIIRVSFGVTQPSEVQRLDDRKESLYRDIIRDGVPQMPGAMDLVKRLHDGGIPIAVGSSAPPENVELVSEQLGLNPFLSGKVTGWDVQRGKPDPQVFELAANQIGISPAECVVIEDAPVGIEAARRAGMRVIGLVGTHPAKALSSADRVIAHLDELNTESLRAMIAPSSTQRFPNNGQ